MAASVRFPCEMHAFLFFGDLSAESRIMQTENTETRNTYIRRKTNERN